MKMKTAGRRDHRFCSPSTRRSMPAADAATSPHTEPITLNASRFERLMRLVLEHRSQGLEELARVIDDDVTEFAQGEPFADDRTLVLLRKNQD